MKTKPPTPSGRSEPPAGDPDHELNALLLNEIQLVLSEKRTSLSYMRTGIAVFALPLSVLGLLIATSRMYVVSETLPLLIPVLAVCAGLLVLGTYIVTRAVLRMRHYDRMMRAMKVRHTRLAEFVD